MKSALYIAAVLVLTGFAGPASAFGGVAASHIEAGGALFHPVTSKSVVLDSQGRFLTFRNGRGFRVSPRVIMRSLREHKFHNISVMHIRRGKYHVKALDAYGRRVRLVIDPYSGRIVRLRYR